MPRAGDGAAGPFGDRVPRDLEQPDAERGGALPVRRAGTLLEPADAGQGREERPLGDVLRVVVIAELVGRVAVHLGEVLPVQGLEAGRVRLRSLHESPIAVEVGEARTALLRASTFLNAGRAIALHPDRRRIRDADMANLADDDPTFAAVRPRSATIRAPVTTSTPRRRGPPGRAAFRGGSSGRSSPAEGPAQAIEATGPQRA